MFYLYHHNDLSRLAELFSVLRTQYRASPLAEDVLLAPNKGLGRWLAIEIAESEGVVANLRVALPGQWFWQIIERLMPEAHESAQEFEADRLRWHLYRALPDMARHIPEVAAYLDTPIDDIRRWQLAVRLADVFDQYLVYRGDMLADWQAGQRGTGAGTWQSDVWRYLIVDYGLGSTHRASLVDTLVQRLMSDTPNLAAPLDRVCPPRLYAFGLVALAPDHLKLMYALARHIDVHFLLPNPSAAYWGDVTRARLPLVLPDDPHALPGELTAEGHPLLGAFGRMARDTLRLMYADAFSDMIEPELGEMMEYNAPGNNSLLHRIQTDIIKLEPRVTDAGMHSEDRSLEIHACHSALREIQVLHDQLLDRLAADTTLAPRHIVVMLSDVAAYVPAINTVFGGAVGDRHLPFTVADRTQASLHPIVSCIVDLLDLPLWRWEASRLLDLLAVPAVRRAFDLSEADVAQATTWVDEAGIRWGRDAAHRASLQAGTFEQNSWRFGLDRLLLGVAQSDDEALVEGVAPWSDLEGHGAQALGGLSAFEHTLRQYAESLAQAATPGAWLERLNNLVDDLIQPATDDPAETRAVETLRNAFASLDAAAAAFTAAGQNVDAASDSTIAWTAIRDHLRSLLDAPTERQPFLSGGITFCGLVPLRAVPFRLVCMLGLNDGVFPRQDSGRGFNVMLDAPRLGDRSIRDDDRLLFLQALTAAGDALYLSYIGQDLRSGEDLPPSPILGEFLAFVRPYYFHGTSANDVDAQLIHHQPMQPFSARYFDPAEPDPRVFTFAGNWREATSAQRSARSSAQGWLDHSRAPLSTDARAIDLANLVRFFDNPPKAFFADRLGLKLDRQVNQVKDAEPIELDALERSSIQRRLFDRAVADDVDEIATQPSELERARGHLPPPPRAATAYATEADIINALLPVHRAWQESDLQSVAIDLVIQTAHGPQRLVGRVNDVGTTHLRRVTPSRLKTRFCLRQWITYLAMVASGHERRLALAGRSAKKGSDNIVAVEGAVKPAKALALLTQLVEHFMAGQQTPLLFHPDMADDYSPDGADPFTTLWKRYSKTQSFSASHLVNDAYFRLLLGNDDAPLGNEADNPFIEALHAIWSPMDAALQSIDLPTPDNQSRDGAHA